MIEFAEYTTILQRSILTHRILSNLSKFAISFKSISFDWYFQFTVESRSRVLGKRCNYFICSVLPKCTTDRSTINFL